MPSTVATPPREPPSSYFVTGAVWQTPGVPCPHERSGPRGAGATGGRPADGSFADLSTSELLLFAQAKATLSLVEPAPVDVALDDFLAGVDAEHLERVALERFGDTPGSVTELMLERLRELAAEAQR